MPTRHEDVGALDREVDGQHDESPTDDAQRRTLTTILSIGEFPDDDGAGTYLDQRIQAKAGQGHRPCRKRCDRENNNTDHIPSERDTLKNEPAANQPRSLGRR